VPGGKFGDTGNCIAGCGKEGYQADLNFAARPVPDISSSNNGSPEKKAANSRTFYRLSSPSVSGIMRSARRLVADWTHLFGSRSATIGGFEEATFKLCESKQITEYAEIGPNFNGGRLRLTGLRFPGILISSRCAREAPS